MNENARLGAIKGGSPGHCTRLRSPLSLRSLHSSLRNHFGPSLGCQTRENWEVGVWRVEGGVDYAAKGNAPSLRRRLTTRTISCPPTNQPDRQALKHPTRLAAAESPPRLRDTSRPGHLTRSHAPSACPSACV